MKIGVSLYSYHQYANDGSMGVKGCIKKAAEDGFSGLDFVGVGLGYEDYLAYAKDIGKYCRDTGIEPVCFCTGADFLRCGDIKDEIAKVKRNIDIAEAYGCPIFRHDISGGFPSHIEGKTYDDAIEIIAPAVREITKYAEEKGIVTTTENHGYFSQDSDRVEKLIRAVNEKNFGALIDVGNFHCVDEAAEDGVKRLAPYIRHAHAKDFHIKSPSVPDPGEGWFGTRGGGRLRGAIIGHGDVNITKCIEILKNSGYDGYLNIEFEGMEDPLRGIAVGFENLKRYMGN